MARRLRRPIRFSTGEEVQYQGKPVKVLGMNYRTMEAIILHGEEHRIVPFAELEVIDGMGVEFR